MSKYRAELVQVAAVVFAMLQDDMCGTTSLDNKDDATIPSSIFNGVINERYRQEEKWGPQHHSKEKWLTILTEEVGEVARAILENK